MIKTEKCGFITMRIALKTMSSLATNSKMHIPLHVVGAGKCDLLMNLRMNFGMNGLL